MLRRSLRVLGGSSTALAESYSKVQKVWSLDFKGKPLTTTLEMAHQMPDRHQAVPMFHILNDKGEVAQGCTVDVDALAPKALCERMIKTMVVQNAIDTVLLDSQRQGRISFYMTGFQEEACVVGSAAGLRDDDYIFLQYREFAAMTYRGYGIAERIAQCMGNIEDPAKGRQMPVHYGSPQLHVQTVSSPLGTKLPHAAGAGYAFRLEQNGRMVVCYFGEGAASEGDFHAGLNFAATRNAATMFFCRNNGYAISTPTHDQYHGDGILLRGIAYGMPSYRVDGHDVLAVLHTTQQARKVVMGGDTSAGAEPEAKTGSPVLIEAMSYRGGDHSTSDDSSAYRAKEEIATMHAMFDPIRRFELFLEQRGWWSAKESAELRAATQAEVLKELNRQEHLALWPVAQLFTDTTQEKTPRLQEQERQVLAHAKRYKEEYGHLVDNM